jgi:small subunit ribosomal protein S17e
MGRIKTQQIKRTSLQLMKDHGSEFDTDFNKNKEKVSEFAIIKSKKLRNVIAGYVTRLAKVKE